MGDPTEPGFYWVWEDGPVEPNPCVEWWDGYAWEVPGEPPGWRPAAWAGPLQPPPRPTPPGPAR